MEESVELKALATLLPGKKAGTHSIGGWVGPRVGPEVLEKRKIPGF
jgi:hypothetical protein